MCRAHWHLTEEGGLGFEEEVGWLVMTAFSLIGEFKIFEGFFVLLDILGELEELKGFTVATLVAFLEESDL